MLMGELGPANAGDMMDPKPLLLALEVTQTIALAWIWKCGTGCDSLLTKACNPATPNDAGNGNWGSLFRNFSATTFNTSEAAASIAMLKVDDDELLSLVSSFLTCRHFKSPSVKWCARMILTKFLLPSIGDCAGQTVHSLIPHGSVPEAAARCSR